MGGLLAVHAHPDDESLWTGALLATWAAAGAPVTVVTCTRGEQGEVIPPALAHLAGDQEAFAAHRSAELAAALAALGVTDHLFLDTVAGDGPWVDSGMVWDASGQAALGPEVPDGAFATVDVELAAERLAAVVRSRRPAVVVGYEPGGGYGHPDHVHAHRVMMRAVELAAGGPAGGDVSDDLGGVDAWRVGCVLWAAVDVDRLVEARESCAVHLPDGLASSVGTALPSAAVPGKALDVLVDVRPVLARVLAALRAHETQVQAVAELGNGDVPARYALSNGLVAPVLDPEAYRVAPGWSASAVRWPQGVRVA